MTNRSLLCVFFALIAGACSSVVSTVAAQEYVSQKLQLGQHTVTATLPAGFTLELLTTELSVPRVLHFSGKRLFVGSRSGKVYWLDPPYQQPQVLVTLPDYPHSVVLVKDTLYVAQTDGIYAASYSDATVTLAPEDFKQIVALPGGRGHNSRTLKTGPDGKLYVSLGIAGNCSDQYLHESYPVDDRRGGVFVVDVTETAASLTPYAAGLRNPVGFDWHPVTNVMYATNNGPDHLGYTVPPEYFAKLDQHSFHGMPWYQYDGQKMIRDTCIAGEPPLAIDKVIQPSATFPARSAPMDMLFLTRDVNAAQYANDALVAIHGSWATDNGSGDGDPSTRREPKLVRVAFDDGIVVGVSDFVTGFQLANGARWARPMGLASGPDGDIYFTSDDGVQGLYRLSYKP